MKFLKKFLFWIFAPLSGIVLLMYVFDVDYLLKAVRVTYLNGYNTAFLDDYQYFDNRIIENGAVQPWNIHKDYNKIPETPKLLETHSELKTTAFLIIKNDSIWHESYFDGYGKNSHTNSFSMAKSYVSASLGKAIMEGKIKGLDQPVSDFFPEFSEGLASKMTIGDLASMASGLNWDEKYYSPFSVVTRAYFDEDLKKVILNLKTTEQPGQKFKYSSGDTQLLAMIVEKATGETLSDYISKHFWKPLGCENQAFWQVDNPEGIEKAYCCIAANARDFARLGKLYKQKGNWNGKQILDTAFVELSVHPRFEGAPYGYGFWLSDYLGKNIFYMRGHLGQFVIVIPQDDLIIVRLGHLKGLQTETDPHSNDLYVYIDEAYQMLTKEYDYAIEGKN
ncbi:MAG: serine hydrolase [Flavobacteriaceae bacterium]